MNKPTHSAFADTAEDAIALQEAQVGEAVEWMEKVY